MNNKIIRLSQLAIFTAVAFIFSYIENLFPLPIPFPGIKLGLANLIVVIVLYKDGFPCALCVSLLRNILNALTFGSLFGLFYSLAGSILSLLVMALLRKIKHPQLSSVSISAVGGIIHNMGQFLVAVLLVGFSSIIRYLPFLYFAGMIAGILIGILATLIRKRLPLLNNRN